MYQQCHSSNLFLVHLGSIPRRQTKSSKLSKKRLIQVGGTNRAYATVFSRIGNEEFKQITQASVYGQPRNRRNKLGVGLIFLNDPAKYAAALSQINGTSSTGHYLQIRGVHNKSVKSKNNVSENQSILQRIFGVGKPKLIVDESSYKEYQEAIKKLDQNEKNAHNEGFVRATFMARENKPAKGILAGFYENVIRQGTISLLRFGFIVVVVYIVVAKFILPFIGFKIKINGSSLIDLGDNNFDMEEKVNVTFEDVCGIDEAKAEVQEIVEYLRDPMRYTKLGARLPKGVLLVGPPGTGKTLLARAIAGEADCAFYHASGSQFDEILVGQGAKRVRELFHKAKENSPSVIFIDEIDSVGHKRTSSPLQPYANQTINQLLSEMDGFEQNQGVIVIGATNKKENLDEALLRPGRFDVQVHVRAPDLAGRKDIFRLYLDKIVHGDVNVTLLAKGTTGFTGADIENMVNQAALKAASDNSRLVSMRHLDDARDRILMGPARIKGRFPDEEANRNTAFHEAGHAIVALYTKHSDPIHKVTIIPRGGTLGHMATLPEKDQLQVTKAQMLAKLDVALAGRIAEEIVFGDENVSTGAASDLKTATSIAEYLVKTFGISARLGLRDFSNSEHELGILAINERGPATSEAIDQEIQKVLQESYDRAKEILVKRKREHQMLAEALLEHETLTKTEVEKVVTGEKLNKPQKTIAPPRKARRPATEPGVNLRYNKEGDE